MTEPTAPLIAVVEDEDHLAQGLLFNLKAEGYRTHHESDGDSALAWLLAPPEKPAAVILDCMLPGADGFTIVKNPSRSRHLHPRPASHRPLPPRGHPRRHRSRRRRLPSQAIRPQHPPRPRQIPAPPHRLAVDTRAGSPRTPNPPTSTPSTTAPSASTPLSSSPLTAPPTSPSWRPTSSATSPPTRARSSPAKPSSSRSGASTKTLTTRAIDNFIVRLRRYIEDDPANPRHLVTVRGVGYRFIANP